MFESLTKDEILDLIASNAKKLGKLHHIKLTGEYCERAYYPLLEQQKALLEELKKRNSK